MATNYPYERLSLDGVTAVLADERVQARAQTNYRTLALAWVLLMTVVRIASVAGLPLSDGEGYYYAWSRFLDWSYYDHPPLVAWMARATTLFGASPLAVRLGPILCAGAVGWLVYDLGARLYRPRTGFFALILVTALPVFLASSFILNPEAPLAPLWVGFLCVVERMRQRDAWQLPLAAGLLLGTAFLAKYTALLLVPATIVYVVACPPMRRWLKRPAFYAGGAVALVVAFPVVWWNASRSWPSVQWQLVERGVRSLAIAPENRLTHLLAVASLSGGGPVSNVVRVAVGQFVSYSPLLAPLLVFALVRSLRRVRRDERDVFIGAFTWPVLIPLLVAMARFRDSEPHWTMMALVPAAIVTAEFADARWSQSARVRTAAFAGLALSGLLFVAGNLHARTAALVRVVPAARYEPRSDMINELIGWDAVRARVLLAAHDVHGDVVVASTQYALCGRLMFEIGDVPPVYCPTARRSAFDFFDRRDPPRDATVIALTTDFYADTPTALEHRTCSNVDTVSIERGGRRVVRYFVQSCAPERAEPVRTASR